MQSLGSLGFLDGLDGIHIGDVQEALDGFAQFSPFLAVRDEENVDVSWTEQFVADVVFRAIRVDRPALVEEPVVQVSSDIRS